MCLERKTPSCLPGRLERHSDVALPRTSRGREHLVDLKRSEQIYLVIRDRACFQAQYKKTAAMQRSFYISIYESHWTLLVVG